MFNKVQEQKIQHYMKRQLFTLRNLVGVTDQKSAEDYVYMQFLEQNYRKLKQHGIPNAEFMKKLKSIWEQFKRDNNYTY